MEAKCKEAYDFFLDTVKTDLCEFIEHIDYS